MSTKVKKILLCDGKDCEKSIPKPSFGIMNNDWITMSRADKHYCSLDCFESDSYNNTDFIENIITNIL
jgi:hypothetical protein